MLVRRGLAKGDMHQISHGLRVTARLGCEIALNGDMSVITGAGQIQSLLQARESGDDSPLFV